MLQQKPAWNVRQNLSFSNCTSEEIVSFDILKSYRIVKSSRQPRLLSTVGIFSDSFISRGKYFQGKVNKSATRIVCAETTRLFYLLINNFKLTNSVIKTEFLQKSTPCFLFSELMIKVKLVIWFWLHVLWVELLSYFICSFIFDSTLQWVLFCKKRKPVLITIQMTVMATMNTTHYSEIVSLLTRILSFIIWMK